MRRRGEVITTFVVVFAIAAFLFGVSKNPIKSLLGFGGGDSKTKQTRVTKTESRPIIVTGQDGKAYILQATKTETSTLDTSEEPKTTLWQKLLMLPKLWLILMVLGIFFPPLAAFMHLINQKLLGESKKVIMSVEEALKRVDDPVLKQKMLDAMSKVQDASTKILVSKLKNSK